ncbi:unnamed protein product [Meganyctiphanes norvegica]|uniref:C2H2-type domain-containing protein n=1 Tax=Meganyctiphanes norvegica TaxID=48144 RepID=A0AAV2QU96_MEGNR
MRLSHIFFTEHQREHTEENPLQCSQGNNAFSYNFFFIRYQRMHNGENLYQCSHCDKAFSHTTGFIVHKEHTLERNYINALTVARLSKKKQTLIEHKIAQTGEKPYQYNQCDKAF